MNFAVHTLIKFYFTKKKDSLQLHAQLYELTNVYENVKYFNVICCSFCLRLHKKITNIVACYGNLTHFGVTFCSFYLRLHEKLTNVIVFYRNLKYFGVIFYNFCVRLHEKLTNVGAFYEHLKHFGVQFNSFCLWFHDKLTNIIVFYADLKYFGLRVIHSPLLENKSEVWMHGGGGESSWPICTDHMQSLFIELYAGLTRQQTKTTIIGLTTIFLTLANSGETKWRISSVNSLKNPLVPPHWIHMGSFLH